MHRVLGAVLLIMISENRSFDGIFRQYWFTFKGSQGTVFCAKVRNKDIRNKVVFFSFKLYVSYVVLF